jgi:hypothetical protein
MAQVIRGGPFQVVERARFCLESVEALKYRRANRGREAAVHLRDVLCYSGAIL